MIVPVSAWSDIIPDEALSTVDAKMLEIQGQIKALEELSNVTATTKADNIVMDEETHELYLTAEGVQIGDKISMEDMGNVLVQANSEGLVTMMI